jgi:sigma-E factor negative regulatory protein RseB
MTEAAAACDSVAFHGVQIASWQGSGRSSESVIQVWHRPGGGFVTQSSSAAADGAGERQLDPDALVDQAQVMTLTPSLLALMRANYVITYSGPGQVDGRPAGVVDIRHPGGALAARFWLDDATRLPLRRQLFDGQARKFSEDAFIGLSVGATQLGSMPAADAQPWSGQLTAAQRAALRMRGWPLPSSMAGGLTLFSATQTPAKSGKVIELSYSDGLSVVSVFVQRGELPRSLPGWRRVVTGGGRRVFAVDPDDRSLAWSAGGFVYTVISDAPVSTIDLAVGRLPHDSAPGFWDRMQRGLRRIVSWANPFG